MTKYLLFFLIILTGSPVQAVTIADDTPVKPVNIPEKNLEEYRQKDAFNYETIQNKTNIIARTWDWIKRKFIYAVEKILNWIFGAKTGGKILQIFLRALPYLAAVLFVYLIFRFLIGIDLIRMGKTKKNNLNKVYISDEERIIQEEDLNKLIKEAIQNKQYRLAVRYYYLNLLKQLIDKGLIEWHNEKTNRDYVRELSQSQVAPYFKNLTFIYDYIWYGNYQPGEKEFEEIERDFQNLHI